MNSKIGRGNKVSEFEGFSPTKVDLVNFEKIVLKRVKPKDHSIRISTKKLLFKRDEKVYSSARYLPNNGVDIYKGELRFNSPNISIYFNKKRTKILVQRVYSKDLELGYMNEIYEQFLDYINSKINN